MANRCLWATNDLGVFPELESESSLQSRAQAMNSRIEGSRKNQAIEGVSVGKNLTADGYLLWAAGAFFSPLRTSAPDLMDFAK